MYRKHCVGLLSALLGMTFVSTLTGCNRQAQNLKVAVWADGRLSVNGKSSSLEEFRAALRTVDRQNGMVLLYRESGTQASTPTATEVCKALGAAGVRDRVSRTPDFAVVPRSVEELMEDMRWFMEGDPAHSQEELAKEADHDYEEIKALGLVDRAKRDFAGHIPNAKIERMSMAYFRDTNVVWCDLSYRIAGSDESHAESFGYTRGKAGQWDLEWRKQEGHDRARAF